MVVFFVASSNPNLYSVVSTPKLPSLSLSHKNVISHFNKTKYFTPSTNVQPKSTVGSSQSGDTTSTSNSPVQNSPVQTSDSINANPISYQAVSSSYLGSVLGYVSGISCPGSNVCYAVGYSSGQRLPMVIKSADGGVSWVQETLPVGVTQIDSISCINDLICDASGAGYLGFSGIIITTNDGGQTWSIAYQGGSRISQVNCSTISECIAAAGVVEGTSAVLMMSNYSFTTFVTENLTQLFGGTGRTCVLESSCYFLTQHVLGDSLNDYGTYDFRQCQ